MNEEVISSARWREFLRWFTGAHQGWLISVDSLGADRAPIRLMQNVPLVGVFDEPDRLVIAAGRGRQRAERIVEHPVALRCPHTAEGAETGLDIDTDTGEQVQLRFRSAVAPELVDGL